MGCENDEIFVAKVLLTALSYTTKRSIAAINTKKGIVDLEDEFLKRKSSTIIFDALYEKYPFLRTMVAFPSGLKLILAQIISNCKRSNSDDRQTAVKKILALGQEVVFVNFTSFHRK